jgi:hypothetical protein
MPAEYMFVRRLMSVSARCDEGTNGKAGSSDQWEV